MPQFPKLEADIIVLARGVAAGIEANPETYPNPPISGQELADKLDAYTALKNQITQTEALLTKLVGEKNKTVAELSEMTKSDLGYAQIIAKQDKSALAKIGWSSRSAPSPLGIPGQCLAFEVSLAESGKLRFKWQSPVDGGKPVAYKIRRESGGQVIDVAVAFETRAEIDQSPSTETYLYHVTAINKAGEGLPSNTIQLAL
jgi:hypothetical protein